MLTVLPIIKGKALVAVAGYPEDQIEEIKKAGVEYFIHIRSNLLEELRKFQELVL